jgi:hypothetical protein
LSDFWDKYYIPVQNELFDIEEINPAEAYRRQAEAINLSGPIYAEIESIKDKLSRVIRIEKELRSRVLAQNIDRINSTLRGAELLEAFLLDAAKDFMMPDGTIRDVSETLIRLARRKQKYEHRVSQLMRRISAIEAMADKCDRILNWAKHEARMELGLGG